MAYTLTSRTPGVKNSKSGNTLALWKRSGATGNSFQKPNQPERWHVKSCRLRRAVGYPGGGHTCVFGIKHSSGPARLRLQCQVKSSNHFLGFWKEFPVAPQFIEKYFQKAKLLRNPNTRLPSPCGCKIADSLFFTIWSRSIIISKKALAGRSKF